MHMQAIVHIFYFKENFSLTRSAFIHVHSDTDCPFSIPNDVPKR